MNKENGYVLIGVGVLTPFLLSMVEDCPFSISVLFGILILLSGIICLIIANKREKKKNEIEQGSIKSQQTGSYSINSNRYMGKRIMTVDDYVLPYPVWILSGFVAAAVIFGFMATFVTIISSILSGNQGNWTVAFILWGITVLITVFDLIGYFSNKKETIDTLRSSEMHLRRKAEMVGAKRDRQNNLDKAELLMKQKQQVSDMGYQKYHNAANQKEGDWAIAGGIAQGLGGIGAGLFAAASTIQNNAKIRQDNEIRTAYRGMVMMETAKQMNDLDRKAEALRNKTVAQYTVNENTAELFNNLTISREYYRSTWGPVVVKLKVQNHGNETVFGSINVVLERKGKQVASCPALLPDEGIQPEKEGVCYSLCTPAKLDRFALVSKNAIKNPWHDSMLISGIKLWTK